MMGFQAQDGGWAGSGFSGRMGTSRIDRPSWSPRDERRSLFRGLDPNRTHASNRRHLMVPKHKDITRKGVRLQDIPADIRQSIKDTTKDENILTLVEIFI